jgi:tRNA pseudouridine55 synthase
LDGVVLIDKPVGPSAFDAIKVVRRNFATRKVGHAGTLDPMASGLMVICTGRYTRLVPFLQDTVKVYRAVVRLGQSTASDDVETEVTREAPVPSMDEPHIAQVLKKFEGQVLQTPPIFSALKHRGMRLYQLARAGSDLQVPPRTVQIDRVSVCTFDAPFLEIEVVCHKGTYIRSLARDIGLALGTVAHLYALRRTHTSGFSVTEAVPMDLLALEKDPQRLLQYVVPAARALSSVMPQVMLHAADVPKMRNGNLLPLADYPGVSPDAANIALLDDVAELCAIATVQGEWLRPTRVFL